MDSIAERFAKIERERKAIVAYELRRARKRTVDGEGTPEERLRLANAGVVNPGKALAEQSPEEVEQLALIKSGVLR